MTSWGKSPNYPEGSGSFKRNKQHASVLLFSQSTLHQGPIEWAFQGSVWPRDIMCRNNTAPVTTRDIKHSRCEKKKKKERKGSKTRRLRCSSCRCLPAEDISSPSDSETPAASLLLMSPHICSALNMQPCVASEAREPRCWNSFCRCTNVAPKGERRKKKKKRFVVTLNECSKSGGAV